MNISVQDQQTQIETLLCETKRPGIENLLAYLDTSGFYTGPASTKFHGCYSGGLAAHSLGVYDLLIEFNKLLRLECPWESIVIAALLHDVCKVGAYIGTEKPYAYNKTQPKGHAVLSIERIKKHIVLTELEEMMIRYHMGVYGLKEFDDAKGEYTLRGESMANAWFHHPIIKVMYFCDELDTLQAKANEGIKN
jgi:23S rRNA maturation-related 3'-5' exoribonuclease YhaM